MLGHVTSHSSEAGYKLLYPVYLNYFIGHLPGEPVGSHYTVDKIIVM